MAKKNWVPFVHKDKAFDYAGDKLAKAWPSLHAVDQGVVAVDVADAEITGGQPSVAKDLGRRGGVLVVAVHDVGAADLNLPDAPGGHGRTARVDDAQVAERARTADGAEVRTARGVLALG
jgi:hypothetical protein